MCGNFILPRGEKSLWIFYSSVQLDFTINHKILKAIGAEHIRFHDLRHTFATLSLKSGVDVKTLSGALGHYSAGFTLNTYTHATAQMKQDAADTIGGVISQQMR